MDVMTIVGNRPQFVKMGPLSAELRARGFRELVVHTGQHYDINMSDVFFEELSLPKPDVRLSITASTHGAMTAEMLAALEREMLERRPPCVIVFGDTNTTLAAALAAVKLHIPVAHVEAGPRIYDLRAPEEINRIVADHASQLRFCPDRTSVENLARENIRDGVYMTGDVMFDAFRRYAPVARERSTILSSLGVENGAFALLTVHRPSNTDDPESLQRLMALLERAPLPVALPLHPRTEAALKRHGLWDRARAIRGARITPAVGYLDALALVEAAAVVITDSGGLQKEAFFAGKPVVVLSDTTPWPAIRDDGWQFCAWRDGAIDVDRTVHAIGHYRPTSARGDWFGDGNAAARMVDLLESHGWLGRPSGTS